MLQIPNCQWAKKRYAVYILFVCLLFIWLDKNCEVIISRNWTKRVLSALINQLYMNYN